MSDVIAVLKISRAEIDACDVNRVLSQLHSFTDSMEMVMELKEHVLYVVEGYDNDARVLAEIPEVRKYFQALVKEWPHWLWYLMRGQGQISMLVAMLCDVKVIHGPGEAWGAQFLNMTEMSAVVNDLIQRGNALFTAFPMSKEQVMSAMDSAIEEIRGN